MPDKLRTTENGEVYIDGNLRLVGPKEMVTSTSSRLSHPLEGALMRIEGPNVDPVEETISKGMLEGKGFVKHQDGVWRQVTNATGLKQ